MPKSERIVKIMNTAITLPYQILKLPMREQSVLLALSTLFPNVTCFETSIERIAEFMNLCDTTIKKAVRGLESKGIISREIKREKGKFDGMSWTISLAALTTMSPVITSPVIKYPTAEMAINGDFSHTERSEITEDILDIYLYVDTDTAARLNIEVAAKKCKPEKVRKVLEALKTLQNCSEPFIYSPKNKPMQSFSADEVAQIVTELDAQTFKKLCNHVNPRTNSLNYVFSALLNKWKCSKSAVDDRYSEALSGNHFTKKQMNSIIKAAETTCKSSEIGIVAGFLSVLWKKMQSYTYDKSKEYGYFMSMIKNAAAPTESNSSFRKHYQQASPLLKSSSSAPSYDLDELINYALTHTPTVKNA